MFKCQKAVSREYTWEYFNVIFELLFSGALKVFRMWIPLYRVYNILRNAHDELKSVSR